MKRVHLLLGSLVAMFMLSANSAWAQYVKVTDEDGTVSWVEIDGVINGTNIEIYKGDWQSAIDYSTKGSIDLNEVWSRSGGRGTHYEVTSIGDYAFYICRGLTSVEIPSSVTRIGSFAFHWCSSLTSIVVESGNSIYDSRDNCNAIIETATNTLIQGCNNTIIPNSVTIIGYDAFDGYNGLTTIDIPSSVTSIGDYAFVNCNYLTSVYIPSSVTSIGEHAFAVCGLTSIDIPSSVTSIGSYAFSYCDFLTSVYIPSNVTSIGSGVFYECSSLTSIVVESGNSVYDSRNNCNAIIETATNTLIQGCNNTIIPNSVTIIGYAAFSGCSGLTSIEIPSSVTSIGSWAFGNSGLTSIEIPSSVKSIRNYAFSGCSGLTSVTSYITDVFETESSVFSDCDNATLYVPAGLANTYRSTKDWNRFSKIEEIPGIALAMSCNNKGKVKVNGGVQFTNDMGEVSVYDGVDNTFVFQPNDNCELRQVLIDGLDVTLSVENNQLTTKVHEGSKMIVMFDKKSFDVNGDGNVDISDVVKLVNIILGQ